MEDKTSSQQVPEEVLEQKSTEPKLDSTQPESNESNKGLKEQFTLVFNRLNYILSDLKQSFPQIIYPEDDATTKRESSGNTYQLFVLPPLSWKAGSNSQKKTKQKPSLFPESLMFQTLASFSPLKDSIEVKYTTVFQSSPTENLPFILTPEGKALVGDELRDLLIYGKLEPNQANPSLETRSMLHLIESTLGATVLYFFYMDPEYFNHRILPYLSTELSWPIDWFSGQLIRQQTISSLLKQHAVLDKDMLLLDSSEALKTLEAILKSHELVSTQNETQNDNSDNVSFFSNSSSPNLLDAAVFAHFHIMNTVFPPKHSLREMAKDFPLLQKHASKMAQEYFPKASKK